LGGFALNVKTAFKFFFQLQLAPLQPGVPRWTEKQGRAVQVDPMKPMLKALGTKRLKLWHDEPPSTFAFKFNLRRYTKAQRVEVFGKIKDKDGNQITPGEAAFPGSLHLAADP